MKSIIIYISLSVLLFSCKEKEVERVELKHKRISLKETVVRKNIMDTVMEIAYDPIQLSSGMVGKSNKILRQNYRRIWLMKNASDKELIHLLQNGNHVVRATAFEGLYKRKAPKTYNYLREMLEDSVIYMNYHHGMKKEIITLTEYCIDKLPQKYIMDFNMTRKEKREIMAIYDRKRDRY